MLARRLLALDYVLEHPRLPWLPTESEKGHRRIMGYNDLWMLKVHLDELGTPPVDGKEVAA